MNGRRLLSLALAGAAVLTLAFGSGAFTSVSAERGVSVAVASDENAYVGYHESADLLLTGEESVDLVTVENRFANEIAIEDVSVASNGLISEVEYDEEKFSAGSSETISGSAKCEQLRTTNASVTVEVAGSDVWAEIDGDTATREIGVTCAPSEAVRFYGNSGQIEIRALPDEVSVDYWTMNTSRDDTPSYRGEEDVNTNEKLNTKQTFNRDANNSVVAVYLPKYDVTYVNPHYENDITADQLNDDLDDVGLEYDRVLKGERNGN